LAAWLEISSMFFWGELLANSSAEFRAEILIETVFEMLVGFLEILTL